MNLMSRNEAIMRQAGMDIRPDETQAETAQRVHAETLRLRKMNEKARAKREARAKAKADAKPGKISAKKAKAIARDSQQGRDLRERKSLMKSVE